MKWKSDMGDNYETLNAVRIGGKNLVLAFDPGSGSYVTFYREATFTGSYLYSGLTSGGDYLKMMGLFSRRLRREIRKVSRQRRRVSRVILTGQHCLSDSQDEDLQGRLVVLASSSLAPEYRTSDYQLGYAMGGSGCKPDTDDGTVQFVELYSGDYSKWDRRDIMGIADPKQLPAWARKKLRNQKRTAKD